MFSKTTLALSAAIVLSAAFPALAATKHLIVSPMLIRRFITGFPPLLVAAVQRLVAQLAVALARDRALVHHQIAGDWLSPTTKQPVVEFFNRPWWREVTRGGHLVSFLVFPKIAVVSAANTSGRFSQ